MTPEQLYDLANEALKQQRWRDAIPLLEKALPLFPHVAQLRVALLQCRQRLLLGENLLEDSGLNDARYQSWVNLQEARLPDPLIPLRHDWWEPTLSDTGHEFEWLPHHGGPAQHFDDWPQHGWLVLRNHNCILRQGALQAVEQWLSQLTDPEYDPHVIYADEDCLTSDGSRIHPWFKPGYTPESFWSSPWLEGLSLWRLSWLRTNRLPLPPFDSEERWCWTMQALTLMPRIAGVPKILSHWLDYPPQITEEARKLRASFLQSTLNRIGVNVSSVTPHIKQQGCFHIQWASPSRATCRIVIPTRDRSDLLETCLQSVWRTRSLCANSLELEIVVMDNGSVEESTNDLFSRWRLKLANRFRVIPDPLRFNWSRLNNIGAQECNADLLLFLNNDIQALEPGWLDAMSSQALRPEIGCVGALLLYPSLRIQHAGVVVGMHGGADHAYAGLPYPTSTHRGRAQLLTNWGAVTGACLMVRSELFHTAGGFDEALPVEFNDVEFCLRIAQLGYRHVVTPDAVLIHHESQTRDARASSTAADAHVRLTQFWNSRLTSTSPYWPASCAPHHTDGRPIGLEHLL